MKVTIFGATGKTGIEVVRHALDEGHEVTAFVRDPDRLDVEHDNLAIVQGDAEDAGAVERAVQGADAVISALGQTKTSSSRLLTRAGEHIMHAMEQHGVERFISLVGAGVNTPDDTSTLGRKFMRGLMKILARDVLEDAQQHADQVMASDFDWTLVRPPRLTEGDEQGNYRSGQLSLGPGASLSRADLADFMVQQIQSDQYVGRAPMVSY